MAVSAPFEIAGTILALISLYLAGDSFLDNAIQYGMKKRISSKSIGAYLLSFGAVIDEFAVIFVASSHGYGDISFGTLQGSNIVTMVVFLIALPFVFIGSYRKSVKDGAILLVSSIALLLLALVFPIVPWYAGVLLAAIFLLYLYAGRGTPPPIEAEYIHVEYSIPSMIVALILLGLASDAIVNYTHGIGTVFQIPAFFSGFIITGVAGSLPEIVMFVLGVRKGDRDATLGIVTGSTLYKATMIMGATMLFGIIDLRVAYWSIFIMIIYASIFLLFTLTKVRRAYFGIPVIATAAFLALYFLA